jgi:hypothetical protein
MRQFILVFVQALVRGNIAESSIAARSGCGWLAQAKALQKKRRFLETNLAEPDPTRPW